MKRRICQGCRGECYWLDFNVPLEQMKVVCLACKGEGWVIESIPKTDAIADAQLWQQYYLKHSRKAQDALENIRKGIPSLAKIYAREAAHEAIEAFQA